MNWIEFTLSLPYPTADLMLSFIAWYFWVGIGFSIVLLVLHSREACRGTFNNRNRRHFPMSVLVPFLILVFYPLSLVALLILKYWED